MIITITGPRSIGKSTISKIVAKKLKLRYISSDEIGEKAMKKFGGLDKAIKSGLIKKFIKKDAYGLIRKEYKRDNFVFDLSGGSISSTDFPEASKKVKKVAKSRSIVIGLLPFTDEDKVVKLLFKREKNRKHFRNTNKKELSEKVRRHYKKFPKIFKTFCDLVVYTENERPLVIADEIVNFVHENKNE